MVPEAAVPAQSRTVSDTLVTLAGNGRHVVDTGDPVDRYLLGRPDACPQAALEWRGPEAFARAHGAACGVDHHFGTSWGANRDQQVCLRVQSGANAGLLYVYDPTWDEYAVVDPDIPLAAVQEAVERARQCGKHLAVEDFMALLPQAPTVHPTPGPEL